MNSCLFEKLDQLKEYSKKFAKSEIFLLGSIRVTVATITSEEDVFLQEWSQKMLRESSRPFGYFYKIGVVALAIKQIDDIDLRVSPDKIIETGQIVDGRKIKKKRFKLMYDLVKSFDAEIVQRVYAKYVEIAQEVVREVDEEIVVEDIGTPPEETVETDKREIRIIKDDQDSDVVIPEDPYGDIVVE